MFRRWISNFYNKYKEKMGLIIKILIVIAIIVFVMYTFFSNNDTDTNTQDGTNIYKPQETIISGSDISDQDYEEDSNLVDRFIEYCNDKSIEEAYNLLTDECKENLYPTLEDFKQKYCDRYFLEKKEYSIQSWVTNGNYDTYQIRIVNDMLSTGEYDSGAYQDYITIVSDGENKKININGYIYAKEINKNSNTNGINIDVKKVDVYMDYEEYTLEVTNNTENVIILDSMQNPSRTLTLQLSDENVRTVNTNSIKYIDLIVNPEETREVKIKFNKKYTTDSISQYIIFSKVVKNYTEYINNQTEYNDFIEIKVEV